MLYILHMYVPSHSMYCTWGLLPFMYMCMILSITILHMQTAEQQSISRIEEGFIGQHFVFGNTVSFISSTYPCKDVNGVFCSQDLHLHSALKVHVYTEEEQAKAKANARQEQNVLSCSSQDLNPCAPLAAFGSTFTSNRCTKLHYVYQWVVQTVCWTTNKVKLHMGFLRCIRDIPSIILPSGYALMQYSKEPLASGKSLLNWDSL